MYKSILAATCLIGFTLFFQSSAFSQKLEIPAPIFHIVLPSPADASIDNIAQDQFLQLVAAQVAQDNIKKLDRKDFLPRGARTEYCVVLRDSGSQFGFVDVLQRILGASEDFGPADNSARKMFSWKQVESCENF